MAKKTYAEFICEKYPQLREMAEYYAALGLSEPVLWAESELNGEPAVAKAALIYALRQQITAHDDPLWVTRIQSNGVSLDNPQLLKNAQDVLEKISNAGLALSELTPLVRLIQAETVDNITSLLEEGPAISCIPLPQGRESEWQLFTVDEDGQALAEITGLAGICDDKC